MSYSVRSATQYAIGDLDRSEYIRSQMAAHPEYRDRIADEMFRNPGKYPIFHRERIEDGYEEAPDATGTMRQWAKFRPGPVKFLGWMTPEEYETELTRRQEARERDDA